MPFLIVQNWEKLNREVWSYLENLVSTPEDIYVELLRYRLLQISREEIEKPENVVALNDPARAKDSFRNLPIPSNETGCIGALREYYRILGQQFGARIAEKYREKLEGWITEHNLRYRVSNDCNLELTIQGSLATQFEFLKKSLENNVHRTEALHDLENNLRKLGDVDEVRNCIRTASNLLEGIIIDKSTIRADTLTRALPGCATAFPHASLIRCVENVYKFCSDYPNIRHPGQPSNSLRNLKKDDALLMLAITIGFGTFILDNNASGKILSGDI